MGRKKLFSLIEIAVAMAVAAIGVAAIMALLPIAVKSTSDSVGDTLAAAIEGAKDMIANGTLALSLEAGPADDSFVVKDWDINDRKATLAVRKHQ